MATYVEFINGSLGYRRYHDKGRQQPLGRAVGLKPNWMPHVLDATAGFGRDAFALARLGCQVQMLERSPIVTALLNDGLKRAYHDPKFGTWFRQHLQLIHTDACYWLVRCIEYPDVIYLDPMYPPRHKIALVKKAQQLLQQVVGKDIDAEDLLAVAIIYAKKRVVVKRPRWAPTLGKYSPSMSIMSKNTRFDVYLTG